jgi:putative transport protein
MITFLASHPLLLLFSVSAIGYLIGRIRIFGTSLGVAAVLFVGLAFGAIDPSLKLPEIIYQFGLVLFVYTVGLAGGGGFFQSFRSGGGVRDNVLVGGSLLFATALTVIVGRLLGFSDRLSAGLFAGSLTNTPALAGVIESIRTAAATELALEEPVVGYSIAYPMGVIGMIAALTITRRLMRGSTGASASKALREPLVSTTVRIEHEEAIGHSISELITAQQWRVVFGRFRRGEQVALIDPHLPLQRGDLVTAVGTAPELDRAVASLGSRNEVRLEFDRSHLDIRRIFVSHRSVAGRRIAELQLPQRFGVVLTRIRRGDVDILPDRDTVLELGDVVRALGPAESLDAVSTELGDSYRSLSEIDVLTFGVGICLGLLLGAIPIPLPGGITLSLGIAGGPLVVALILGALARTGPIVWSLPYGANLTLRQAGVVFFLAGIGTRAGEAFINTFASAGGVKLFLAGTVITCATAALVLWIGAGILHIPFGRLSGILSGLQTQPAVLSYALEETGDEEPNIGYATVYPVALIGKIILAQVVLTLA